VNLSTDDRGPTYSVVAPIPRFLELAAEGGGRKGRSRPRRTLGFGVLPPAKRTWLEDPEDGEDRAPRTLHGKLLVVRVRRRKKCHVYVLSGSPNFTKAALLGENDELALLTRHAKRPAGLGLGPVPVGPP
jgi:hypothetical protein